jgi:hypothetical protein
VSDTFDSDPNSLPTVTKALRESWITAAPGGNIDAVAAPFSMRAVLDAVHALETRIATLEGA